jgi:hypothetical protein
MADHWPWEDFADVHSPLEVAERSRPQLPLAEPEPVGLSC